MKKAPIVSTGRGGAGMLFSFPFIFHFSPFFSLCAVVLKHPTNACTMYQRSNYPFNSPTGNIGPSTHPTPSAASLTTPTIKQSQYTTGRGGSGNMAVNDPSVPAHAEMARAAQDVGAPAMRQTEQTGEAFVHHGRGGGGNILKLERVTSHGGGVINGEERDEVDGNGEVVPGGRRGSMEKIGYGERRGRSVGEGRGYELGNGGVGAGQQQQQQRQQQPQQPQRQQSVTRQGSASRISGLMERLRSPSGRRSPSAKRS